MRNKEREPLKKTVANIKTLVAMQLKESLSFSFKSDLKGSLTKLILYVLGIGAITGVIAAILMVLNLLGVLGIGGFVPMPMWNVVFFVLLLLNLLACISKVTDALFFSTDNQILLTMPVSPNHVFISKIIVFVFNELIRNCFSLLPWLLSFGIANGMPLYYYPWLIVVMLILSILPVAIASLLSIPTIYIKAFLKRFPWAQSLIVLGVLVTATVFVFRFAEAVSSIEDLRISQTWNTVYFPAITDFSQKFENALHPLVHLTHLAVGYTGKGATNPHLMTVFTPYTGFVLLSLLGIIIAFFLVSNFIAKPLYFSMATKSFEFAKPSFRHRYYRGKRFLSKLTPYRIDADGNFSDEERGRFLETILNKAVRKHLSCDDKDALVQSLNELAKGKAVFRLGEGPVSDVSGTCLVFVQEEHTERLAVMRPTRHGARLYCPHHVWRKNIGKPSFFSFLLKEILVDMRSYDTVAAAYLLFIVGPVAILILNSIFSSMRTSFQGQTFTVLFNALIICLVFLASNVSMASVYSREGRANYQLRSSPINYTRTLASKLFLRAVVLTGSMIFTIIIYANHNTLNAMRFDLLFFSFYFVYLGHLLWSAELDFVSPQVELYADAGGKLTINPNEAKSSASAVILSAIFAGLAFFFMRESATMGFYHLLIVAILFLLARIVLFYTKIRAYSTGTYEGRGR